MKAIYQDAHPESCEGIRKQLSAFIPKHSKYIVDLGSGDGDGPATTARMLPDAKVVAVEASPFMIICGQRQNRDCVNLEFHHQLAEKTFLQSNTVDTVTITLLLHECSDEGKASILREAYRILKPNGTIILSDTPQNDLLTYRGFYERSIAGKYNSRVNRKLRVEEEFATEDDLIIEDTISAANTSKRKEIKKKTKITLRRQERKLKNMRVKTMQSPKKGTKVSSPTSNKAI